jgi:hypothetical protein
VRSLLVCTALLLSSALVLADDHSVIFDEDVDFSTFKTFTMRDATITSARPELKFPAVAKSLGESIRAALVTSGLKDLPDRGDLVAESSVKGVDYEIGPFGRANVVRPPRGSAGPTGSTVDFTEVALVVDLKRAGSEVLIWRGVYHDTEKDAGKLADALPKDAAKLLSEFPPRKKK